MAYRPKCQTAGWEGWRVERTAGSAILRYVRKKNTYSIKYIKPPRRKCNELIKARRKKHVAGRVQEEIIIVLACESRRFSGCHLSRRRQATTGNTTASAGYHWL